jgi:hypothetical protein
METVHFSPTTLVTGIFPGRARSAELAKGLPVRVWPCDDDHPLRWWRTCTAGSFPPLAWTELQAALSGTSIISEPRWAAARQGDAAAAVGIAMPMIPVVAIMLKVDLVMSAVLLNALKGNAASAAVLAHALQTLHDREEAAASWRSALASGRIEKNASRTRRRS